MVQHPGNGLLWYDMRHNYRSLLHEHQAQTQNRKQLIMELLIFIAYSCTVILIMALAKSGISIARKNRINNGNKTSQNLAHSVRNNGRNQRTDSHNNLYSGKAIPEVVRVRSKPGYQNVRGYAFEVPEMSDKKNQFLKLDKRLSLIPIKHFQLGEILVYNGVRGQVTLLPKTIAVYDELSDEFTCWPLKEFEKRFVPII